MTRPLRQRGGAVSRDSGSHERPREEWVEIPVPAIVEESTFARAQELLHENKVHARRRTIVIRRCIPVSSGPPPTNGRGPKNHAADAADSRSCLLRSGSTGASFRWGITTFSYFRGADKSRLSDPAVLIQK